MRETLLIAEGNAELRNLYQQFLTGRGYDVETASDGLDCLAKLRRGMPTVLVLDRELCWGGGDGVLAWLREERGTGDISVVLTATAGCSLDTLDDSGPPVARVLPKPFSLATLLEGVRAAAGGHRRENHPSGETPHATRRWPDR